MYACISHAQECQFAVTLEMSICGHAQELRHHVNQRSCSGTLTCGCRWRTELVEGGTMFLSDGGWEHSTAGAESSAETSAEQFLTAHRNTGAWHSTRHHMHAYSQYNLLLRQHHYRRDISNILICCLGNGLLYSPNPTLATYQYLSLQNYW